MNSKIKQSKSNQEIEKIDSWFNELIDHLESDKFLMKEELVTPETEKMYNSLINGNVEELMEINKTASDMFFFQKATIDFINEFKSRGIKYNKLAFDLGNAKILSWVEIANDDETSEDNLILAEAKVNSVYHSKGYHISTTIVEERDNIPVPDHYRVINLRN